MERKSTSRLSGDKQGATGIHMKTTWSHVYFLRLGKMLTNAKKKKGKQNPETFRRQGITKLRITLAEWESREIIY